jgi:hypothetical protein
VVAAVFVCVFPASGGEQASLLIAAAPIERPSDPAHGWVVVRQESAARRPGDVAAAEPGSILLHLPPRRSGELSTADFDGAARLVTTLLAMPEAIAARGDEVVLVFPPVADETPRRRTVIRVRTTPAPGGAGWHYDAGSGRLTALPSLPAGGRLLGFGSTARDLVALLEGPELLVLRERQWQPISLPTGFESSTTMTLVSGGPSFALVQPGTAWLGSLEWAPSSPVFGPPPRIPMSVGPVPTVVWTAASWTWPKDLSAVSVQLVGDEPIATGRVDGSGLVRVQSLAAAAPRVLAEVEVPEPFVTAAIADVGRIALVWPDGEPSADRRLLPRLRITEVSAHTGAVLYSGQLRAPPPVVADELRLLAIAAAGAMLAVVLIVLRPGGSSSDAAPLPRGFGPADPGRRVAASLIDLVISAILASLLTGQSALHILSVMAILTRPGVIDALLLTLLIGAGCSTVLEGLLGRTPGKLLLGLRVVRPVAAVGPGGERLPVLGRPGLWRAGLRNAVRWLAPPIAMGGLSGLDGRHRGDLAAGTMVVSRHAGSAKRDDPPPASG